MAAALLKKEKQRGPIIRRSDPPAGNRLVISGDFLSHKGLIAEVKAVRLTAVFVAIAVNVAGGGAFFARPVLPAMLFAITVNVAGGGASLGRVGESVPGCATG
jgi:hypothetical protein